MAKKLKLQKLGLKFQEIRSDNNLSIEEVSKKINVNTKFLKAIEDDNYDVFPARAFAKAYYYKYADFLKISDEFPVKLKAESIQSKKTNKKYLISYIYNNINILFFALFIITALIFLLNNIEPADKASEFLPIENQLIKDSLEEFNNQPKKITPIAPKKNLELFFIGECWVEIYTDNTEPLIYKLYNKDEKLILELEKSFTLIVGNTDNVVARYLGSNIDLKKNANEKKVSINIFKNERLD